MQQQVDNRFSSTKTYMQRQNATINDRIRRFGGMIQGGFARQDPIQAGDRRQALAKIQNHQPGECNGNAELTPNLHSLEDLWNEWKFGLAGRKAARHFTARECGGMGTAERR